jgi:hypothetical protein
MHATTRLTLAAALALPFLTHSAVAQSDAVTTGNTGKVVESSNSNNGKPEPEPFLLSLTVKESTVVAEDRLHQVQNLRDGERIPYSEKDGQNYQDVGTNIDVQQPTRLGDSLVVTVQVDSTSLVPTPNFSPGNLPQISQWRVHVNAVLPPGKPTVIYSAIDGISNHKVEIQATATPLNAR